MALTSQQLQSIQTTLDQIKASAAGITSQVNTLAQAKQAGLAITPTTTTQQASDFLKSSANQNLVVPAPSQYVSNIPNISQDILNSTANTQAIYKEMLASSEAQRIAVEQQMAEAQNTQKSLTQKISDFFTNRPTAQQQIQTVQEQFQIPETLKLQRQNLETMQGLREQIVGLDTTYAQAQLQNENRLAPMDIINRGASELERKYLIQRNSMAAQLSSYAAYNEALQGNITQANQQAQLFVQAATYEDQMNLKQFETFLNINQNLISSLDSKEQNILNQRQNLLQNLLDQKTKEKEFMMGLMTQYPEANWSGFNFNTGTPEQAAQIASTRQTKPNVFGSAESGYYEQTFNPATNKWEYRRVTSPMGVGTDTTTTSYLVQQILNRQLDIASPALTKNQRAAILQSLASQGLSVPRKLTANEIGAQGQASAGLSDVNRLRQLLGASNNYDKLNLLAKAKAPGFLKNVLGAGETNAVLTDVSDIITRIRTGAALNEQEISIYQNYRPQIGDSPQQVELKLRQLEGFYLGMSGIPVTVINPQTNEAFVFQDLFNPQQRLGLRQAINNGYQVVY